MPDRLKIFCCLIVNYVERQVININNLLILWYNNTACFPAELVYYSLRRTNHGHVPVWVEYHESKEEAEI